MFSLKKNKIQKRKLLAKYFWLTPTKYQPLQKKNKTNKKHESAS